MMKIKAEDFGLQENEKVSRFNDILIDEEGNIETQEFLEYFRRSIYNLLRVDREYFLDEPSFGANYDRFTQSNNG